MTTTRNLYVRTDDEDIWARAATVAKQQRLSLSSYVALALTTAVTRDEKKPRRTKR